MDLKGCTPGFLSGNVSLSYLWWGLSLGGFLRALHSLTLRHCICSHFHQWKCPPVSRSYLEPVRALLLSAVVFLSYQFPFRHLSSSLSPDILSFSTRSVRKYGELTKALLHLFLMPRFRVPRECRWAYASGLWELLRMGMCDRYVLMKLICLRSVVKR